MEFCYPNEREGAVDISAANSHHLHRHELLGQPEMTAGPGYFYRRRSDHEIPDNPLKDPREPPLKKPEYFAPPCINQLAHHHHHHHHQHPPPSHRDHHQHRHHPHPPLSQHDHHHHPHQHNNQWTVNGIRSGFADVGHLNNVNQIIFDSQEFGLAKSMTDNPDGRQTSFESQDFVQGFRSDQITYVDEEYVSRSSSCIPENSAAGAVATREFQQHCSDSQIPKRNQNAIAMELQTFGDSHQFQAPTDGTLNQLSNGNQKNEGCAILDMRSELLDPELMNGFTIIETGPLLSFSEIQTEKEAYPEQAADNVESESSEYEICIDDDNHNQDDDDNNDDNASDVDDEDIKVPIWLDLDPVPGPWSKWSFDALFFPDDHESDIKSGEWCPSKRIQNELGTGFRCSGSGNDLADLELRREIEDWCGWYADVECFYNHVTTSCHGSVNGRRIRSNRHTTAFERNVHEIPHTERDNVIGVAPKPDYLCTLCGVTFTLQQRFITHGCHSQRQHGLIQRQQLARSKPVAVKLVKTFACQFCHKQYKRQADYTKHMMAKHHMDINSLYS